MHITMYATKKKKKDFYNFFWIQFHINISAFSLFIFFFLSSCFLFFLFSSIITD